MQTKTRFDPPRNRASYEYNPGMAHASNSWDAMNAAEYWCWSARRHGCGKSYIQRKIAAAADIARARVYLSIAQQMRRRSSKVLP